MKRSYQNVFGTSSKPSKRTRFTMDDDSDDEEDSSCIYTMNNDIYFYSDVTPKSCFELIRELKKTTKTVEELNRKYNVNARINLHINSNGGCVHSAFGVIDMITTNKIEVDTYIEGMAASAGTIISMVGKHRYITENSYMLVHQLSTFIGGKMMEIEDDFKNTKNVMDRIKSLYRRYTTFRAKELDDLLKHDLLLDAEKCIKVGLVDEIYQ